MGRFSRRSPEEQAKRQAASVMKQLQGKLIKSVGTVRNYEKSLKSVAMTLAQQGKDLKSLTPESAHSYLELRAEEVYQSGLDMERQAIQAMMIHVTRMLQEEERLEVVKSIHEDVLKSRAYTQEQLQDITKRQHEHNSISTEIAYFAGLRAHELLTLEREEIRPPDERPALAEKFSGRQGQRYTVIGKGGLIRTVVIPSNLVERLEERRLKQPKSVVDRQINYEKNYDIGGGQAWSQSFSDASKRELGWSQGGHGCRHSYAQERMEELQGKESILDRQKVLRIVSQELGHFRPEITEIYLR